MNDKFIRRKRKEDKNKNKLLKDLNDSENYNFFKIASERLILALKLSIVKIKSDAKKGILLNDEIEETASENGTTGLPEESLQEKKMKLEISNNPPAYATNNFILSFPSSLNSIYLNDSGLKDIDSISKYNEDNPFNANNKFVIEDNLNGPQNTENDLAFGNFLSFCSNPLNNFNFDDNFMNNLNYENDDTYRI